MRRFATLARTAALVGLVLPTAHAREFGHVFRTLAAPLQAAHRIPPPPSDDPCLEDLAKQMDWLEHHLACYGTVVAKQPDVWGQSRLTRARLEYEEEMRKQIGLFTERTTKTWPCPTPPARRA
jgi:hypothetical protein